MLHCIVQVSMVACGFVGIVRKCSNLDVFVIRNGLVVLVVVLVKIPPVVRQSEEKLLSLLLTMEVVLRGHLLPQMMDP